MKAYGLGKFFIKFLVNFTVIGKVSEKIGKLVRVNNEKKLISDEEIEN